MCTLVQRHPIHSTEKKTKKTYYFCDIFSSIFLSLSLLFILVSPHILCVCLSPEASQATRLINNYRVHKIGREKKKLSFDVRHERNQNYKETEHYKEERKLAHSFLNPQLLFFGFFIASFCCFYLICLSLFFYSFYLYKHLKLLL